LRFRFDLGPEDRTQPLQIAGVAVLPHGCVFIIQVVRCTDDAHTVDRWQHHAAAQHDHMRRLERLHRDICELHAPQPQLRYGMQLERLGRVGKDDDGRSRHLFDRRIEHAAQAAATRVELRSHQRTRLDPAGLRKPQPAIEDGHAGVRRSLLARHELRIVGRQPGHRLLLGLELFRIARELQDPALVVAGAAQARPLMQ
jgi:hypothetical protein